MTDKDHMQDWLDSQSELQEKMPSDHPTDLFKLYDRDAATDEDRLAAINFIQWNSKAIIHELVELESETGWKPWAKSRHINLEAARGELVDVMHFVANLALVLGMDEAADIMQRYHRKHAKNAKRQEEGYDGVSTKCPKCSRALDDDAVHCIVAEDRTSGYCSKKQGGGKWVSEVAQ